jgi:hypothetical protein
VEGKEVGAGVKGNRSESVSVRGNNNVIDLYANRFILHTLALCVLE